MTRSPNRAALAVAAAALFALAVPAAASAVVTPVSAPPLLTVTSDDASDTITLGVAGGVITVNDGTATTTTTVTADNTAEIVVNAGKGNDVVDASALAAANYKSLAVNGGEGDDTITGGANADTIHGDAGNDRIIPFKGNDKAPNGGINGGTGDDVMVWNNGDGSDEDIGGEGTDEVEVNGSPTAGDNFTYQPLTPVPASGADVLFKRTNLGAFSIELKAERLTMNQLGGDDTAEPDAAAPTGVAATGTSVTLNGGTGNDKLTGTDGGDQINGGGGEDTLSGGEGADLIKGGDDNDALKGENGDDRLVGDRGGDTLKGGAGDDAMVWNNGDGSDTDEGEAGNDEVEVNGSPGAAGDAFTYRPSTKLAGGVQFNRTNLGPFEINLTAEHLVMNELAGDDTAAPDPAAPTGLAPLTSLTLNGGGGNDNLTGGDSSDQINGGAGNDTINAGKGNDSADGGEGNDRLLTRDSAGDLVHGGAGTDSAQTDAVTVDAVDGVEALDATPPAVVDKKALLPTLGKVKITGKGQKLIAHLPVSCPKAEAGGCRATLTLQTAKAARLGAVHAVVVLGSKSVKLKAGQNVTASIHLAAGASGLAKGGVLAARVLITSTDAAGNSAAHSQALRLHLPRH
jgi:Ca2+-binding RTX toxin-like protein